MKSCPVCDRQYPDDSAFCEHDGVALRTPLPREDPLLGQTIKGKYRIVKKLGSGGMGSVYLGEQLSIGRRVALKVLHGEFANDREFIKRFHQEARMAAHLNHRNLVTIHDFDQSDDGSLFIAMEYVEGDNLRDLIRQGPLSLTQAVGIARQIAEGLSAAHQAGVIHRDIKPENIMIARTTKEVKVMDFGIARLRDVETVARLTQPGMIMGTPAYMAPEQIEGGEVNEKTDIYAFGIVLYEMLSGDTPFKAPTPGAVLIKHISDTPTPLRKIREDAPLPLERLVMQCLEKKPALRQNSMQDLATELHKIEESLKTGVSPMPATVRLQKPKTARFALGSAIVAIVFLGGIAAYWNFSGSQPATTISALEVLADKNEVEVGESVSLNARVRSADGRLMDVSKGLEWVSSDPSVAEVDSEGKLVGKSGGTAKILARLDEIVAPAITLIVKQRMSAPPGGAVDVVGLVVEPTAARIRVKQHARLKIKAKYSDGTEREVNEGIDWQSSDASVVKIDRSGDAEGQKRGKASITAQLGQIKAEPILISVDEIRGAEPKPAPGRKIVEENQNAGSGPANPVSQAPTAPPQNNPQESQFVPSANSKSVVSDYIRSERERGRR